MKPMGGGLTPAQMRGQQIYATGVSANGDELIAVMSGIDVPASVMPCINCHGEQGQGKPEGGITPSNLTWPSLARSYTGEGHNGRKHPAYNEKSLVKAIAMGLDPAGNELQKLMPRYQMNQSSMSDLIEYLKVLGNQGHQGIEEDEIRIGMLLPQNRQKGEAIFKVLQSFFNGMNKAGGLYGRQISLLGYTPAAQNPVPALKKFIQEKNVFAFCGSSLDKGESEIVSYLNTIKVPLIGAISGEEPKSVLGNREVFYLLPGAGYQAAALFDLAVDSLEIGQNETALIHGAGNVDDLVQSGRKAGLGKFKTCSWNNNPLAKLPEWKAAGTKVLFLKGIPSEGTVALLKALEELEWYPHLLLPGEQAGPAFLDAPGKLATQTLIAYPTWFTVLSPKMKASFDEFAASNQLSSQYKQSQYAVLAAGILMSEGLQASGKELSREKLRGELEKVQALQTGLVPALTYGVNRRTGSSRVFIVSPEAGKGSLRLVQERAK